MSVLLTFRRLFCSIAALAVLTTLFATLSAAPASAGANYQKPKVGQCRNLTRAQLYKTSNSTAPIACSATHTAQTFFVGKLSARVWKSSKRKIAVAVTSKCGPAYSAAVGRSYKKRLLSAYTYGWWLPTKAQRGKGARWFRCDVMLFRGENAMTPLTRTSAPFLSVPTPDIQALCMTSNFYPTTCDAAHFLRVTGAFKIRAKAYPGKKGIRAIALRKCPALTTGENYYWDGPSKIEWKYGYKWVLCETVESELTPPGRGVRVGREVGVLPDPRVHSDSGRR